MTTKTLPTSTVVELTGVTFRRINHLIDKGALLLTSGESSPGTGHQREFDAVDIACVLAFLDLSTVLGIERVPIPLATRVLDAVRGHPWEQWSVGDELMSLTVAPAKYRQAGMRLLDQALADQAEEEEAA